MWATPQDFFDKLNEEFHFDLDPCATAENAKCAKYYTKEINGLEQNWGAQSVLQPTLRQRNPQMGKEGLRGIVQTKHFSSNAYPCAYRHTIFSRIYLSQSQRDSLH